MEENKVRVILVALSLQLDHKSQEIHLRVSENDEVPLKVLDHLTEVWKRLASLSEEYARERKSDLYDWETHEGESPPVPAMVGGDASTDIVSLIYTFSINKIMRRYKKWWPKLNGLFKEYHTGYDRLKGPSVAEFNAHFERLLTNLNTVTGYIKRMHGGELVHTRDLEDWRIFVRAMDEAVDLSKKMRDHTSVWELIGETFCWQENRGYASFYHGLGKLLTTEDAIDSLLTFAHSPRLRTAFRYKLHVHAVPQAPRVLVKLPSSVKEWRTVIECVCQGYKVQNTRQVLGIAQKLRKDDQSLKVHAECNLINFLETATSIPALSYIGVSKLCCHPCYLWIEAVNLVKGRKYSVKGTHGKWYPAWGMPNRTGDPVGTEVGRLAQLEYLEHYLRRGDIRLASDSSQCASVAKRPGLSEEEKRIAVRENSANTELLRDQGFPFVTL